MQDATHQVAPVDVSPVLEEQLGDVGVPVDGGPVKSRLTELVGDIDIGTSLKKKTNRMEMSIPSSPV